MKTVYVLNIFPKISETFILNEMLEMQRKGVEVEVLAYKDEKEQVVHPGVSRLEPARYFYKVGPLGWLKSHLYWILRRPAGYARAWALIIRHGEQIRKNFFVQLHDTVILHERRPDHVHAHFGDDASNLAMVYSVLSGVPYTFTTHMHDIFRTPPPNFPVKSRLARKHVTISGHNRDHLIRVVGVRPVDIDVIHCGIDFARIPAEARFDGGSRMILCVARLHPEKALHHLIRACAMLKERGVAFECRIVGDGQERAALETLIRERGLEGEVLLMGNRTQDEVFDLFKRARLKVLPSHFEGIPVSLMEAMAFRVPVVATRISGIPELIESGQSGFLVAADDVSALADRMGELLSDEALCRTFTERGYEKVRREFDLVTETEKLLKLWKTPKEKAA